MNLNWFILQNKVTKLFRKNLVVLIRNVFVLTTINFSISHDYLSGNGSKLHEVTKLHEGTKLHEQKNYTRAQNCTKPNLHELDVCTGVKIKKKNRKKNLKII